MIREGLVRMNGHNPRALIEKPGLPNIAREIIRGNQTTDSCDLKSSQFGLELLPHKIEDKNLWEASFPDCLVSKNNIDTGEANNVQIPDISSHAIPSNKLEDDMNIYADKSVTECELQELSVCHRELMDCVVKDICIDEGTGLREKMSGEKNLQDKDHSKEHYGYNEPLHVSETAIGAEGIEVDINQEKILPKNRPMVGEQGVENSIHELFTFDGCKSQQWQFPTSGDDAIPSAPTSKESRDTAIDGCLSADKKAENHEIASSRIGKSPENSEYEGAEGAITYLGPVVQSGSLSIRSDSSTTSTRSFAFPVLQSEWMSSPVRMEKDDRKHGRTKKGWRQGLCCCGF